MLAIKFFTVGFWLLSEIQATKALKCYICFHAPNVPLLQFLSDDSSCESISRSSSKFVYECENSDDICATFSLSFNAVLPNVIKRECVPRSFKKANKNCYTDTFDRFTALIPELYWLKSKVEICTCETDNCTVSNLKETTVINKVNSNESRTDILVKNVNFSKGLQCYECAYTNPPLPIRHPNITFDKSCDIGQKPNLEFLKNCQNRTCITASNYKSSNGIKFFYRSCIDLNIDSDQNCKNYTKDQLNSLIHRPIISLLNSNVEVCGCGTDGCNAVEIPSLNMHPLKLEETTKRFPDVEGEFQSSVKKTTPYLTNTEMPVNTFSFTDEVNLTKGLQCYECAYTTLQIQLPNIKFDKSCDFGETQNSTYLRDCQSKTCLTASNYKTSHGIKFVYRTCIDPVIDNDGKCTNYTKEQLQLFIQHPFVEFLDSDVEVCGCSTDGCNGFEKSASLPAMISSASLIIPPDAYFAMCSLLIIDLLELK